MELGGVESKDHGMLSKELTAQRRVLVGAPVIDLDSIRVLAE